MNQKTLAGWLKAAIIFVGIFGIMVYAGVLPILGMDLVQQSPEFSNRFLPWLIFLCVSAIPCYAVLVLGWLVASNIGRDRSFSQDNANYLKWVAILAGADTVYFFTGNIVLLFTNMSHPGVVLGSLCIDLVGVAVVIAAAVLSHLIRKAATLQEQNDLTI